MVLVAVEGLENEFVEHLNHVYTCRPGVVVDDEEDGRETLGEVHLFAQLWHVGAEELVYCAVLADL